NAGGLLGMIVAGVGGSAFRARLPIDLRVWIVGGCLGSALGLAGLTLAAVVGPGWPLVANVLFLGFCNGVFAVAAIGAMMGLAGAGEKTREGVRMGVWGASQAIAFGFAGLLGAAGRDIALAVFGDLGAAYQIVFAVEGLLFVAAAILAFGISGRPARLASSARRATPSSDQESFA
ncbi:MAG: PucC family protein, partial [Pseudomonadota bacterium]